MVIWEIVHYLIDLGWLTIIWFNTTGLGPLLHALLHPCPPLELLHPCVDLVPIHLHLSSWAISSVSLSSLTKADGGQYHKGCGGSFDIHPSVVFSTCFWRASKWVMDGTWRLWFFLMGDLLTGCRGIWRLSLPGTANAVALIERLWRERMIICSNEMK